MMAGSGAVPSPPSVAHAVEQGMASSAQPLACAVGCKTTRHGRRKSRLPWGKLSAVACISANLRSVATSPGLLSDDVVHICAPDAADASWAEFCVWLQYFCGMPVMGRFYTTGFDRRGSLVNGLGTVQAIAEGENIACVPQRCWITTPGKGIWEALGRDAGCYSSCAALAIHVAEEWRKGNASAFAPYLRSLPTEADYRRFHPAYLQGEAPLNPDFDVWSGEGGLKHHVRRCYARYAESVVDPPGFAEVFRSFVHIHARRFEGAELVPLVDKANTAPRRELNAAPVAAWVDGDMRYCMRALRDIGAGEEVLLDYQSSQASALAFFTTYGFTLGRGEHGAGEGMCRDLGSGDFGHPGPDADPLLRSVWRFAAEHCHPLEAARPKGRRRTA